MSCTSKTTSLGSPVVQNLVRNGEPIKKTRAGNAIPLQTTAIQVTTSKQQPLSTHHAWALDEPCRTDADMAAALPGTLRQATIRSKKKQKQQQKTAATSTPPPVAV